MPQAADATDHNLGPRFFPPIGHSDDEMTEAVLAIIRKHPYGIQNRELVEGVKTMTGAELTERHRERILRDLERAREIYLRPGSAKSMQVWFPNGRLIHPFFEIIRDLKDKTYRVSIHEGRGEPLVQIQERSFSIVGGERPEGAIFVPLAMLEDFKAMLDELSSRFHDHKGGTKQ